MRRASLDCFLWTWFGFVIVFFSFSGTKLPHYLIYGLTPLFLLMAMHRESLRSRWLAFLPPFLLLATAFALPWLLQTVGERNTNPYFREMLAQPVFGTFHCVLAAALLAAWAVLVFLQRVPIWQRLLANGVLCSISVALILLPAVGKLQQEPVKEAALAAKALGGPVKTWGINMPSFSVYRQAPTRQGEPAAGDLVLTRADALDKLAAYGPLDFVYRKGGIALVRVGQRP